MLDGEPRIRNPPRKHFYGGDIIGRSVLRFDWDAILGLRWASQK